MAKSGEGMKTENASRDVGQDWVVVGVDLG